MPTYERKCEDCSHEWEQVETINGKVLNEDKLDEPICPLCGSTSTHRLISCSSFMLVGSGWAKDGYR